ncbi:thioredoxin family protein [Dawidia soli]|uniref:Thioredoxin family protein n=1 Tax=Dawidia soli TaxID=2782352 RepID=A0AAP2DEQ5_9BACT|nr:thioredoxin family protein [Dawidia soli]MBT1690704.1 thioredoxin family protein [Dawidia soli]
MIRFRLPFVLTLCFFLSGLAAWAQVRENADEAFHQATEHHRPVLLVFAGSDWCAPCIHFEKKILAEHSFQEFADANLVLLKADFPQRARQSDSLRRQNEALAEKYNPSGVFPYILLLRDDGNVVKVLNYHNESPAQFIDEIKPLLLP